MSPFQKANNDISTKQRLVDVSNEELSSGDDSDCPLNESSIYKPSVDGIEEPRRCPVRNRVPRETPGAIPWEAVWL